MIVVPFSPIALTGRDSTLHRLISRRRTITHYKMLNRGDADSKREWLKSCSRLIEFKLDGKFTWLLLD